MKQYKALKPIGRFEKGDFVGGLIEAEIKQHLAAGNIQEGLCCINKFHPHTC